MPVAVNMPSRQQEEDPLDKLAKAVGIASSIYGMNLDRQKLDAEMKRRDVEMQDRQTEREKTGLEIDKLKQEKEGVVGGSTRAALLDNMVPAKEGEKGAFMLQSMGPGGKPLTEWVKKAPKEVAPKDPLAQELAHARLAALKEKQDELSGTQAKQKGLYEIGVKAEEQFKNATSDKSKYDPTSSGQWIDNSEWAPNLMKNDKAIEAQAAMASWVEAFLRDASGAAIPPSERMAYAKDFFPMPGDTEAVVANKEALRQQKMDNALVGAGPKAQVAKGSSAAPAASEVPHDIQKQARQILEKRRKDARR